MDRRDTWMNNSWRRRELICLDEMMRR